MVVLLPLVDFANACSANADGGQPIRSALYLRVDPLVSL
jgi:hypothetical protein